MSKTNPFAFGDMADLPDELKKKATTSRPSYAKQDAVLDMIKGHPGEYTNAEVRVAWFRTNGDVMKETTMRSYLNGLVKRELLCKPTTQSYALVPVAQGEAAVVTPELVAQAEAEQPVEAKPEPEVVAEAPKAEAKPEPEVVAEAPAEAPVVEEATAADDAALTEVDDVLADLDLAIA